MMIETTEQRSQIYEFLSHVFLEEPGAEFVKSLRKASNLNILKETGLDLNQQNQEMDDEKLLEEMVLEYNRLFIGPGKHISPYESVYLDKEKLLWGKRTVEVKKFIESLGLEYKSDWTGLPDHIGVELEFMQRLIQKEKEFWEKDDEEKAYRCLEFEKKFIDEHLSQWVPQFCNKVMAESHSSFYKQIAQLTKDFIEYDKTQINDLLSKEKTEKTL